MWGLRNKEERLEREQRMKGLMRGQSNRDKAEGIVSIEKHTKWLANPIKSTPYRGRRKRGQSRGAYTYPVPMPPLNTVGTEQRS